MITVHHLNNSRSQRVLWLLEELGVAYAVKRYERQASMAAPAALLAVHPLGKSPVITDEGRTVAETGAIIEYLLAKYDTGALLPAAGSEALLRYTYWLHFAEGSAMPPLVMTLVLSRVPGNVPALIRPIARRIVDGLQSSYLNPNLTRQMAFIEAELTAHRWFGGDAFTAADVMMSFPLEAAAQRVPGTRPKVAAWLDTIHARPAYQAALTKGGAYAYA